MGVISGRCFCGAVTWRLEGPVRWAAICHCEDCRRAASADHVSWLGAATADLSWAGPRRAYRSSAHARRTACATCASPMSFESDEIPDQTCLYAASLDDPSWYRPSTHLYWSERVAWSAVSDDLPKHDEGLQAAERRGARIV